MPPSAHLLGAMGMNPAAYSLQRPVDQAASASGAAIGQGMSLLQGHDQGMLLHANSRGSTRSNGAMDAGQTAGSQDFADRLVYNHGQPGTYSFQGNCTFCNQTLFCKSFFSANSMNSVECCKTQLCLKKRGSTTLSCTCIKSKLQAAHVSQVKAEYAVQQHISHHCMLAQLRLCVCLCYDFALNGPPAKYMYLSCRMRKHLRLNSSHLICLLVLQKWIRWLFSTECQARGRSKGGSWPCTSLYPGHCTQEEVNQPSQDITVGSQSE